MGKGECGEDVVVVGGVFNGLRLGEMGGFGVDNGRRVEVLRRGGVEFLLKVLEEGLIGEMEGLRIERSGGVEMGGEGEGVVEMDGLLGDGVEGGGDEGKGGLGDGRGVFGS
ncbi:hypothetical protein, partial [Neisseria sicca]|uniref:hypothetical protein n=1 Tax=Neisseria sicca TaxID=490 RepID=UPI001C99A0FD